MAEGTTSYCATHNYLRRREEKKARKDAERLAKRLASPKKIYSPPKKVSAKQKEKNAEYSARVKEWKKENPECKAKINEYCTKRTDDAHHKRGRGEYLLQSDTWLPVCRSCHSYIEAHPEEAKERGWSESRLAIDQTKPTI